MLFADLGEAERQQLLEQHRWVLSAAELLRLLELEESQGLLLCRAGLAQVGSFGVDGDEGVLSLLGLATSLDRWRCRMEAAASPMG